MTIEERNRIIEDIYKSGFVQNYTYKIASRWALMNYEDVLQYIWEQICMLPPEKFEKLWESGGENKLKQYISTIVWNNARGIRKRSYSELVKQTRNEFTFDTEGWNGIIDDYDRKYQVELKIEVL